MAEEEALLQAEIAELNAIPACLFHLSSGHPERCPVGCFMKGVFVEEDIEALNTFIGGRGVLARFFQAAGPAQCREVARGLRYSAERWLDDPFMGPRGHFEELHAEIQGLEAELTAEGILPEANAGYAAFVHHANNGAVPFTPLQPLSNRRRCLFHQRRCRSCPVGCIFRVVFSARCNQQVFNDIYETFGGAERIPAFFDGIEGGLGPRAALAESLLWEAEAWANHPAGGPRVLIGQLQRRLAYLDTL